MDYEIIYCLTGKIENRVFALNHRIRKRRCKRKSSSWNDLLPAGISLMGGWRKSSCILNSGCNLAAKWLIVAKLWATRQTSRGRLLSVHTWTAPSRQLARKKDSGRRMDDADWTKGTPAVIVERNDRFRSRTPPPHASLLIIGQRLAIRRLQLMKPEVPVIHRSVSLSTRLTAAWSDTQLYSFSGH